MRMLIATVLLAACAPPKLQHHAAQRPARRAEPPTTVNGMVLELVVTGASATVRAARSCRRGEALRPPPPNAESCGPDGVSGVICGALVVGDLVAKGTKKQATSEPHGDPGTLAFTCAVPVTDIEVTLELPSGATRQADTDARGMAAFVIPDDEPAGPVTARAGATSTPQVMYKR